MSLRGWFEPSAPCLSLWNGASSAFGSLQLGNLGLEILPYLREVRRGVPSQLKTLCPRRQEPAWVGFALFAPQLREGGQTCLRGLLGFRAVDALGLKGAIRAYNSKMAIRAHVNQGARQKRHL